jgi:WD40 repeat protein
MSGFSLPPIDLEYSPPPASSSTPARSPEAQAELDRKLKDLHKALGVLTSDTADFMGALKPKWEVPTPATKMSVKEPSLLTGDAARASTAAPNATTTPAAITTHDFACSLLMHPNFDTTFIVGQYHLQEESSTTSSAQPQVRTGAITAYNVLDGKITELWNLPLSHGVLSSTFHPNPDSPTLILALSSGNISLLPMPVLAEPPHAALTTIPIPPSTDGPCTDVVCTSTHLFASFTSGSFVIFQQHSQEIVSYTHITTITAHSFPYGGCTPAEAWSLDVTADNVFTGGDDGVLKAWDLPSILSSPEDPTAPVSTLKTFDAGVTCVKSLTDHRLLVGSYDESVRLLHFPPASSSFTTLWNVSLGGGIWRLAINYDLNRVLVGAMYTGAVTISLDDGAEVGDWFKEHESMVYGAAWVGEDKLTCSFYDKKLCLWK